MLAPDLGLAAFRSPLYASPQRLVNGNLAPTKGPAVAKFIERYLVHGEGDSQGKPVVLAPHQRYILNRLYEYDPATGRLFYDRVVIGMGKGGSKTELVAMIGIAELVGPVAPKLSPHVVVAASSYDQADNVFGAAKAVIGPELVPYFRPFEQELQLVEGDGFMERIAARGGTADGKLPTCFIGDEIHEWNRPAQEKVYTVQAKGLRKRRVPRRGGLSGALQIGISTAGDDLDSLLGRLYQRGIAVASGEVDDPGYLFLWWEAPKAHDEDLEDPEQRRSAILAANPGVGQWQTIEQVEASYRDPTERQGFERYNLNRHVTRADAWLSEATWNALRGPKDAYPEDGAEIVIGFKGSYSRNTTALVGWTPDDYGFVIEAWERDSRDPDWTVPRAEVDAVLYRAMKRWRVRELVCDPMGWVSEVEAWRSEFGEMKLRAEGDEDIVVRAGLVLEFDVKGKRMQQAVDRFKAAVVTENASIRHDGDPRFARHIKNCNAREGRWGTLLEEQDEEHKIDIAQAAIMARQRAMHPPKQKKRSVAKGF